MIVDQVRGVRSSSGALWNGAVFQPGESYPRTVGIGVRVPVAPPGRAGGRGYLPARQTSTHGAVVRPPIRRRGAALWPPSPWDRSSPGRAPDRQSGGSRFDPDRFHHECCSGPDSGASAWYAEDGECDSREQLSLRKSIVPEVRASSNGEDGRIPPCRRGFDSRCPLCFELRW